LIFAERVVGLSSEADRQRPRRFLFPAEIQPEKAISGSYTRGLLDPKSVLAEIWFDREGN
jgi:hypothetical protein